MARVGVPGFAKQPCELGPRIGGVHVDDAYRLDPGFRRFAIEQGRQLTVFDRLPEGFLGGDQDRLVNWIGVDG